MDANGDGFLVEEEIKNIGKWAFGVKADQAEKTWITMKEQMDTNKDRKIDKEEYSTFWMGQCKGKIQPESGEFEREYKKYLLVKLGKLRAGVKRQEQLKVWEKDCEKRKREEASTKPKRRRVSIRIEEPLRETSTASLSEPASAPQTKEGNSSF